MAKDLLNVFTRQAIDKFGHSGTAEYQRRLAPGELPATRCKTCGEVAFVGRSFCPACFGDEVEWISVGAGATLHAFTTQARALRFRAPDVIGVVDIPTVGLVVGPIEGRLETLTIGQPVRVEVAELGDGLRVHRFAVEPLERNR